MSDLNFDLNINHYTMAELEHMIKLSPPYNYKQVHLHAEELKRQIFKTPLEQTKKLEINLFMRSLIEVLERNYIETYIHRIISRQHKIDQKLNKIINLLNTKK